LRNIAAMTGDDLLDEHSFRLFECHVLSASDGRLRSKREIRGANAFGPSHQDGALDGVRQLANVARPVVGHERSGSGSVESADAALIFLPKHLELVVWPR